MTRYNLHTHSFYCGHGEGRIEEYAEEAEKSALALLGFSEHLPFPDDRFHDSRMPYSKKTYYERDVLGMKELYRGRLDILLGWECDYFPEYGSYYDEVRFSSDYLIFGVHHIKREGVYKSLFFRSLCKEDIYGYARRYIEAMSSGLFLYGAHPDVFFINYEKFDEDARCISKDLLEAARETGTPLEMNANGLLRPSRYGRPSYPMREFWQMAAEMKIKVVKGSDAHKVCNLVQPLKLLEDTFSDIEGLSFLTREDILSRISLLKRDGN